MIDIKKIRENPQKYQEGAKAKKFNVDIENFFPYFCDKIFVSSDNVVHIDKAHFDIDLSEFSLPGRLPQGASARFLTYQATKAEPSRITTSLSVHMGRYMLLVVYEVVDS